MSLLEANQNERGIQNWASMGPKDGKLKSFGIGLTVLRKMAKKIGRDRDLALELWDGDYHETKILSLLIDDPKQVTREQAESQVENLEQGYLAHVFSSCDATLAKTPFVIELASEWMTSTDPMRRRCGYGLLYELSKSKKKSAPDDAFFQHWIKHINDSYPSEDNSVLMSMGAALMGMGLRSASLNGPALKVARAIGPIPVKTGKTNCDPFDVVKHLTSDRAKQKLGL
jgi:3-methyladenine DNA glycosylase AlkD